MRIIHRYLGLGKSLQIVIILLISVGRPETKKETITEGRSPYVFNLDPLKGTENNKQTIEGSDAVTQYNR